MASVDKVKVGSTSYDISPSKDGTLNGFTSNDAASPTAWSAANAITTSDTNSTIFSKVTTMIKNVRWLYSKLGTTDFSATGQSTVTGALSALQTGLNGKAASSHSHTTAQLPVSSSQTNSNSYIPTSALVYSMQQKINSLNDAIESIKLSGDPVNLGTWSSISDVDIFLNNHNHDNGYNDLKIGDYVTIQDGTYNSIWVIAGFDCEYNRTAADGITYDNGYGICLIPRTYLTNSTFKGATYIMSTIHTTKLPEIVKKLQNVLGGHIINRNVLLSSGTNSNGYSNAYKWTTAYATLMSKAQLIGSFSNIYDCGEANYRLPIFNSDSYIYPSESNFIYWLRDLGGGTGSSATAYGVECYIDSKYITTYQVTYASYGKLQLTIRPMIYIR